MKTYRLGIIGLGRMGSTIDAEVEGYPAITLPYSIAAAARAIPNLELAAGCDRVADKNEAFRKKWGVEAVYEDYKKMLAEQKLDMVAVCTPGRLHAEMTVVCAKAGVPMIYCEKAMACSMREADEAKNAVESRHIAFNTGVLRRFDPRYHQARELIRAGRIGTVRAVVHYAEASLLHGHIHSVDTILFLLGDRRARAVRGELSPRDLDLKNNRSDKDPLAVYRVEFDDRLEGVTVPAGNWDFEVIGSDGVLRSMNNNIDWALRTRQPLGKKFHSFLPAECPKVEPRSATVNCLQDLIDAHEQHRPTLGNADITHHATEVCLAVAESHRQGGARVELPLQNKDLYVYHF
jgi:predicted dehydrogenase